MTFEKENIGFFVVFLILGGILGSAIGTLLAKIFPSISIIKATLTGPLSFNLEIISFSIKLNISSIVGIIAGIIVFRKV